jgi:protoheme IX farnesyltransferase
MVRTRDRPLPAGRLTSLEVAAFGWITGILGFIYLIVFTNFQATSVGFLTWFSYIWIYTPLKTKTWWNTVVGTLPGALPVLIGWTAAGGRLFGLQGWLLTSIVILWQFPHFMAIAWLYREEYDRAGYRMITNTERTGLVAGWLAVIPAVALIPVSVAALMPSNIVGWVLAFVAVLACLHQIRCSIRFLGERNDLHARRLLIGSLLYLPSMIVIAMINSYF